MAKSKRSRRPHAAIGSGGGALGMVSIGDGGGALGVKGKPSKRAKSKKPKSRNKAGAARATKVK